MERKNYNILLLIKLIESAAADREERKTYKGNRVRRDGSRGAISINKSRKS